MTKPKEITREEAERIIVKQKDLGHQKVVACFGGKWYDLRGVSENDLLDWVNELTGIKPDENNTANLGVFPFGECTVIVSFDVGLWHLSISHEKRYPTYDEIKEARYKFIPDKATIAMFFPPKAEFVNVHPNCFHLWEVKTDA